MKNGHLPDQLIQDAIWNPEAVTVAQKNHIEGCGYCQHRLANYRLLFTDIEQLPKPTFDFDLTALVIKEISEQSFDAGIMPASSISQSPLLQNPAAGKRKNLWVGTVVALMAAVLLGIPAYLFQDFLQDIIAGMSGTITYLIVMSVVLIAAFLMIDEYRKYNQQINNLDI